ncbi:MAG: CPBP family intramembrane metalloprotease [Porticoccaceae bacterium]|nr:CPBP family intramembrane metalloprotease [Porticoccaceae bacterium]MDG1474133.1 CPBP family intramembrane metalloprotease [Porticoccaceae bacterium]
MTDGHDAVSAKKQGRLQRSSASSGNFVTSFSQVLQRHGALMSIIAVTLLLIPGCTDTLLKLITPFQSAPRDYFWATLLILSVFLSYWIVKDRQINTEQLVWAAYLFFISLLEEIAFRALLPVLLANTVGIIMAVVLSNLIFASVHYITLRWKFSNCIGVFIGGLALSRLLNNTEDIVLVILVHWVATFLNTPLAPTLNKTQAS